jgi:hypothetical protein
MNRALRVGALLALISLSSPAVAQTLHGTMYKNPYCTCCEGHAAYLREHDMLLTVKTVENLEKISQDAGIPAGYQGCHSIFLGGYVIEGHVTIEIIRKLLKERPVDVVGLSLKGMPVGVPGMPGERTGPYDVYAIKKDGTATVFATQ